MAVEEICRHERVEIPGGMTTIKEVQEAYGIAYGRARRALKQGYYIRNYEFEEVVIDRDLFNLEYAYNLSYSVFWRNIKRGIYNREHAMQIMDDMIAESVKRLFELSGRIPEKATEKFNSSYQMNWIAHNAMLSYLSKFERRNKITELCREALEHHPAFREHLLCHEDEVGEYGAMGEACEDFSD